METYDYNSTDYLNKMIQNTHGFEIAESCQQFKNMLGLANHVGIIMPTKPSNLY